MKNGTSSQERQASIDLQATRGKSIARTSLKRSSLGTIGTFGQKELLNAQNQLKIAKRGGDPKAVAAAEKKLILAQKNQQEKLNSLGDEYSLNVRVMEKQNKVANTYAKSVGKAKGSIDDFGNNINKFLATNPFVSFLGLGERIGRVDDEEAIKKAEAEYDKQSKILREITRKVEESSKLRKSIAEKQAKVAEVQDKIFQNDLQILKSSEIIKNARSEAAANIGSITAFASEEARPRVNQIVQSSAAFSNVGQAVDLKRQAEIKRDLALRGGSKKEQEEAQINLDAAEKNIESVLKGSVRTIFSSLAEIGETIRKGSPQLADSYNEVEKAILAGIKGEEGARNKIASALDAYSKVVQEKAKQLDEVRLAASTFEKGSQLGQIGTGKKGLEGLGLPNAGKLIEDFKNFKGIKDKDTQAKLLPELLSRLEKFAQFNPKLKDLIFNKSISFMMGCGTKSPVPQA